MDASGLPLLRFPRRRHYRSESCDPIEELHEGLLTRMRYSLTPHASAAVVDVAVRLLGRQYIRSFDSRENFALYLEIQLNGLGSFGRDTGRLLDNAILGYRQ